MIAAAAQKLMRERNQLAAQIEAVRKLESEVSDTLELIALAEADGDAAMAAEGMAALRALAEEAKRREIESLLSGEADMNDAYVEINAGTGGTEAQDWAEMLDAHVHALGGAARLQGGMAGGERGRASRHQVGDDEGERAERVWLAEDRGRGASAGADQPVRFRGAAAHQFRLGVGVSGGR